jgi:hypothetical protein
MAMKAPGTSSPSGKSCLAITGVVEGTLLPMVVGLVLIAEFAQRLDSVVGDHEQGRVGIDKRQNGSD